MLSGILLFQPSLPQCRSGSSSSSNTWCRLKEEGDEGCFPDGTFKLTKRNKFTKKVVTFMRYSNDHVPSHI